MISTTQLRILRLRNALKTQITLRDSKQHNKTIRRAKITNSTGEPPQIPKKKDPKSEEDPDAENLPFDPPRLQSAGPLPIVLQAALNRQLNMHVYSTLLFQLLAAHFANDATTHSCMSALHEAASGEILTYLDSRSAEKNLLMPDYDRFCCDMTVHDLDHMATGGAEERWVLTDTMRLHIRTCQALRALKRTSQVVADQTTCVFVKRRLGPLDSSMHGLHIHILYAFPEVFAMLKIPELDPL